MMTKSMKRLAISTLLLAACVVALGAYTRLEHAGLGCPDWPGCYGFLTVPVSAEDIAIAEARFPHAPVEVEKGWPEMVHRYFASLLGLFILIQAALCYQFYKKSRSLPRDADASALPPKIPLKLSLLLVAVVIGQGMFGMWTVTLKLWPQVVSGHLLGGFTTLALLLLYALRVHQRPLVERPREPRQTLPSELFKWTLLGMALVIGQVFLGAWTASNYAAVACPDFPTCQGEWLPEMDMAKGFDFTQSIGPNYLGGLMENESRVAIHFTHRVGALVLTVYLLWMFAKVWSANKRAKRAANTERRSTANITAVSGGALLVLGALLLQLVLGIINVIWLIPLPIAVAHNAGGALLLLTLVYLNYRVYLATPVKQGIEKTITTHSSHIAENCEATP